MRLIPIKFLKSGMTLGKDIIGRRMEIYLRRDTILNQKYIDRLESLGYSAVYIEDELSEGIEIAETVEQKLRIDTVVKLKDTFVNANQNIKIFRNSLNEMDVLFESILDQMVENHNLIYNMMYIKVFDDYTFSHCVNVALLTAIVGIGFKMQKKDLSDLFKSAVMHDIGKVFIPIEIINKPSPLNEHERVIINQHSYKGYNYLKELDYLNEKGLHGVWMHHERYDGRGYPMGLAKNEISQFAKILNICDVYDALTSDRPYRKAWGQFEAVEFVMANNGQMFDPDITKMFLAKVTPYSPGTIVELSNGYKAIVVKNNINVPLRPVIRIFEEGGLKVNPYEIDMKESKSFLSVTIKKEIPC